MSAMSYERVAETAYRALFHSVSQGFCIIEVLFDEQENPVDDRFLEVNAAFERQTGLSNPVGKTMRRLRRIAVASGRMHFP